MFTCFHAFLEWFQNNMRLKVCYCFSNVVARFLSSCGQLTDPFLFKKGGLKTFRHIQLSTYRLINRVWKWTMFDIWKLLGNYLPCLKRNNFEGTKKKHNCLCTLFRRCAKSNCETKVWNGRNIPLVWCLLHRLVNCDVVTHDKKMRLAIFNYLAIISKEY